MIQSHINMWIANEDRADGLNYLQGSLHTAQNGMCGACGRRIILEVHVAHVHHMLAIAAGGGNGKHNLVLTHGGCNADIGTDYHTYATMWRTYGIAEESLLRNLSGICQHEGCEKLTDTKWCREHGGNVWRNRRTRQCWTEQDYVDDRQRSRDEAAQRRKQWTKLDRAIKHNYDSWILARVKYALTKWQEGTTTNRDGVLSRYPREVYERFMLENPDPYMYWRHNSHREYLNRKHGRVDANDKRRAFLPMAAKYYKNRPPHLMHTMAWFPMVYEHFKGIPWQSPEV